MTTGTHDIRFSCSHCGQKFVVDAAGAGTETVCPGCANPVIVPQLGSLLDRDYVSAAAGKSHEPRRVAEPTRRPREGAPDARLSKSELERELGGPHPELARLQAQLSTAAEERDRLKARAAQAEAEAQRLREQFASATAEAAQRRQAEDDREVARERVRALETDVTARDADLAAVRAQFAALEKDAAEARAEISRLQDESDLHRHNYDRTREKLAAEEKISARAAAAESELRGTQGRLAAAAEKARLLEKEGEELRRDLAQTQAGTELIELRARLKVGDEERGRLGAQLAEVQREAGRLDASGRELREQFETMRVARDEAVRLAEAGSQSALKQGNDVLRGVLDRQKAELDERYAELRRYKRAKHAAHILYALCILAVLGLIGFGLHIFLPSAAR